MSNDGPPHPLLYGVGTVLPLMAGAAIGSLRRPPQMVIAAAPAFASGSLIIGLAFELLEPAF
ncbi:hypothetical protein [Haladaptatus halobius]|uniref:hypothetical protein n=1 Tax=Haladaptatus halobius TaxID=2884875 RepID=UPI001D0B163A|nr:hypothetical protein [Haladaptatus halobius]